jgi:hypothetical protein
MLLPTATAALHRGWFRERKTAVRAEFTALGRKCVDVSSGICNNSDPETAFCDAINNFRKEQ